MIRPIKSKTFYPIVVLSGLVLIALAAFGLYYFNLDRTTKQESTKFNKVLEGNLAYLNQLNLSKSVYGDIAKFMTLINHYKGQVSLTDNELRDYGNTLSTYPNFKHIVNLVGVLNYGKEPYPGYSGRVRSVWSKAKDYATIMSLKGKIDSKLMKYKYSKAISISRPDLVDKRAIRPDIRCTHKLERI